MIGRKVFSVILSALSLYPSNAIAETTSEKLEKFNRQRNDKNKMGMIGLGAWGLSNIGTGLAFYGNAKEDSKYFHEMNMAWGLINLGIAGLGFYGSAKAKNQLDLADTISEQKKMENILLLNTGLDVAYSSIGLYLREMSKTSTDNKDRLKGYGDSLILQGAFLFAFDLTMFYLHSTHNKDLENAIKNIEIKDTSISYNIKL